MDFKLLFTSLLTITVLKQAAGACEYPEEWRDREFLVEFDGAGAKPWAKKFDKNKQTWYHYTGLPSHGLPTVERNCESRADVGDRIYLVEREGSSYFCVEIVPQTRESVPVALMEREVNVGTKAVDVNTCASRINITDHMAWYPRYPLDEINEGITPFKEGFYQATYKKDGTFRCLNNIKSFVRITNNKLEIRTCSSTNNYKEPLTSQMEIVAVEGGSILNSGSAGGFILLSSSLDGEDKTRFYCARYRIEATQTYISLNVGDERKPRCRPDSKYDSSKDGEFLLLLLRASEDNMAHGTPAPTLECSFPQEWRQPSKWWYETEGSTKRSYMFLDKQVDVREGDSAVKQYGCVSQYRLSDLWYVTMDMKPEPKQCVMLTMPVKDKIMLEKSMDAANDKMTASECETQLDQQAWIRVMPKEPIDLSQSPSCPFPSGKYHLGYSEGPDAEDQCDGDTSSSVTVDGNKMTLKGCNSSSTYRQPYRSTMYCLGVWNAVWTGADGDDYILLATEKNGKISMYCARYSLDGGEIRVSLNVNDEGKILCDTGRDSTYYANTPDNMYTLLRLRSLDLTALITLPSNPPPDESIMDATKKAVVTQSTTTTADPGLFVDNGEFPYTPSPGCHLYCFHAGVCVKSAPEVQRCLCRKGYTGSLCETALMEGSCSAGPCHNETTISCVDPDPTHFYCRCKIGFEGTDCSEDIDDCKFKPCQNGGQCHDEKTGYFCSCPDNFLGANCESALTVAWLEDNETTLIIILSVCLSIFVLASVAIAVCICQRKNRKKEKTYEENPYIETSAEPGLDGLRAQSYATYHVWSPDYKNNATMKSIDSDKIRDLGSF